MPLRAKGYRSLLTTGLLLAGYLFLFAGQFNYRYFTIANFYVYSHHGNDGIQRYTSGSHRTVTVPDEQGHHRVALRDNSQRPAHLGIDKRFQFQQGVRVPEIRAPGIFYCSVTRIFIITSAPVYSSTDLPTTCLRGPPCV